jgi:phosphoribosylglycinamide formyltransferase-1
MPGPRAGRALGAKDSGATVVVVAGGVDTGPIVAQRAVPVLDDDDEASLHDRIKVEERAMLVDVIGRMAREGWTVTGRKVTLP